MVDFLKYSGPTLLPATRLSVPITPRITPICSGNTKGIPLALALAVTIHKAQGMTLDRVTNLDQKEFALGLTFVALSCAKAFYISRVHTFNLGSYKGIKKGKYVEPRHEFHCLRASCHQYYLSVSLPISTLSILPIVSHCIYNT